MKVAPLLAQYLYRNKQLDLPGLGSFLLDPSSNVETDTSRQQKQAAIEGITFLPDTTIKTNQPLVDFIAAEAGKIKALAAADLDSYLGLAEQFLNIGKPFLFEGIGSLSKIRAGEYQFVAVGPIAAERKEHTLKEGRTEEAATDYKSIFYLPKEKSHWKKLVAVLLLMGGLAFAIWGGYTVYKKSQARDAEKEIEQTEANAPDTVAITKNDTSVNATKPAAINVPPGTYKFILETADSVRAASRLARLKEFRWNVNLEQKDSAAYIIYMLLPSSAADTTRMIDSLQRLTGKRVYIE